MTQVGLAAARGSRHRVPAHPLAGQEGCAPRGGVRMGREPPGIAALSASPHLSLVVELADRAAV